jgi:hypothetical protein
LKIKNLGGVKKAGWAIWDFAKSLKTAEQFKTKIGSLLKRIGENAVGIRGTLDACKRLLDRALD